MLTLYARCQFDQQMYKPNKIIPLLLVITMSLPRHAARRLRGDVIIKKKKKNHNEP